MRTLKTYTAIIVALYLGLVPSLALAQSSPSEFVIGPQIPITSSWFDQTEIQRAKVHGAKCPDVPPSEANALNDFVLLNYYDLPLTEYIAYQRSGDPVLLGYARKCADAWWQHPQWIKSGAQRDFDNGQGPPPRHAGLGGLMLRAIDGRPEMWDWIVAYTRHQFDNWLKRRINDSTPYYGVREGAFMLHYAVWLAKALPDSYPNAAQIRAQFLADVEAVSVQYFGRLQYPDGSWRWNTYPDEFTDTDSLTLASPAPIGATSLSILPAHGRIAVLDSAGIPQAGVGLRLPSGAIAASTSAVVEVGSTVVAVKPLASVIPSATVLQYNDGTLQGITQPFQVGLLLNALIDVHRLSTNETVKANVANQILKGARHLYSDGPYRTSEIPGLSGKRWRDFFYYYHGGTSVNPTRYEHGGGNYTDLSSNGDCGTSASCTIAIGRQAISTVFSAYAYAYLLSRDEFYKQAGAELFDSAFVGTDGFRGFADDTAKNYNQNYRMGGRYLGWLAGNQPVPTPSPTPIATPTPSPTPVVTPSPTPIPLPSPTFLQPRIVQRVLSNNRDRWETEINQIEQNLGLKVVSCSSNVCLFARRP